MNVKTLKLFLMLINYNQDQDINLLKMNEINF